VVNIDNLYFNAYLEFKPEYFKGYIAKQNDTFKLLKKGCSTIDSYVWITWGILKLPRLGIVDSRHLYLVFDILTLFAFTQSFVYKWLMLTFFAPSFAISQKIFFWLVYSFLKTIARSWTHFSPNHPLRLSA